MKKQRTLSFSFSEDLGSELGQGRCAGAELGRGFQSHDFIAWVRVSTLGCGFLEAEGFNA